jgi:hypothetical protein
MSMYQGSHQPAGPPGYPPQQPGYPPQQQPGYPPPQAGYSQQPPPSRGTSVLAIVGFVLAFCSGPLGFVLSLVAIFQTGRDRKKGRGLAIAGVIISLVITAGSAAAYVALASSTVLDPGCTDGKAAILAFDPSADATDFQATIDALNAAADKAKNDEVRDAMRALAKDYADMKKGIETGQLPDDIVGRVATDAQRVDDLCTVGA